MTLKVLIVDDEYPAREELRYHLDKYDFINIIGEASKVSEALELISALNYDLIFLDISFPVKNGIVLAKEIYKMGKTPYIIYVTAHDNYAVEAFDVDAVDYILKPIDENKFDRAIKRVLKLYELTDKNHNQIRNAHFENASSKLKFLKISKISAEQNGKVLLLNKDEIYFAYVDKNIVFIKRYDDKLITKYTLSSLEKKLKGQNFFRASRSHLINLDKAKEVSMFFKGSYNLIMSDKSNSNIEVSRRQSRELKNIFDL